MRSLDVRVATAIVAGSVLGVLALAPVAAAQESDFGCRATGLRVGSLELSVANPGLTPCVEDEASLGHADIKMPPLTGSVLRVQARAFDATTGPDPEFGFPAGAAANAGILDIQLLGRTIHAKLLNSNLRGFIGPMGCEWVGDGVVLVDNLEIDGTPVPEIPGNAMSRVIPLGVATLYLGWSSDDGTTVRALFLDGPGGLDVTVSESIASCPPEDEA